MNLYKEISGVEFDNYFHTHKSEILTKSEISSLPEMSFIYPYLSYTIYEKSICLLLSGIPSIRLSIFKLEDEYYVSRMDNYHTNTKEISYYLIDTVDGVNQIIKDKLWK